MKKKILMIATGGTIASKETEEGLAPALSSRELLDCVPEVGEVCEVHAVQPFNLDSTNVYSVHWLAIARIIEESYAAYDGFVVTHGTDTMAYTAAALSYLIQGADKPIVLTGSQRSAYSRDTDARANLSDAFLFAALTAMSFWARAPKRRVPAASMPFRASIFPPSPSCARESPSIISRTQSRLARPDSIMRSMRTCSYSR